MATIYLSTLPPSTNNLFATVNGRRVKSRAYKSWLTAARWEVNVSKCRIFRSGLLGVDIMAKVNYTRDCDNLIKPILDMMVFHKTKNPRGIIHDDRYVDDLRIRRVSKADWPGALRVEIRALDGQGCLLQNTGTRS